MKLIVIGSSDYNNSAMIWQVLGDLKPTKVVVVDQPVGAEASVRNWVYKMKQSEVQIDAKYYPVNYNTNYDKATNSMLNTELDANAVLIFCKTLDLHTEELIEKAIALGYTTLRVEE
jgi:hypothetical protein